MTNHSLVYIASQCTCAPYDYTYVYINSHCTSSDYTHVHMHSYGTSNDYTHMSTQKVIVLHLTTHTCLHR